MDWLAIVLRPVVLLVMLFIAWAISRTLYRLIPPGRARDVLYKRRDVIPPVGRRQG